MKLVSKKKTVIEFNDVKKLIEQEEYSDNNGLPLKEESKTISTEFEDAESLLNSESDEKD